MINDQTLRIFLSVFEFTATIYGAVAPFSCLQSPQMMNTVNKRTKQLSTVKVPGLVRALTHAGSLTNFQIST